MGTNSKPGKRTKRAAVEYTEVRIQLHATGLDFVVGQEIKPTWDDCRVMLRALWSSKYGPIAVGGVDVPEEILVSGNKEQLDYMVPLVLRNIDNACMTGAIDLDVDRRVIGIVYVLAWYWYHHLHGPKPIYDPKRYIKTSKVYHKTPELRCPMCTKPHQPPERYKTGSAIFLDYVRWLIKHAIEYHHYTNFSTHFKNHK